MSRMTNKAKKVARRMVVAALLGAAVPVTVQASIINAPVPTNAYIVLGGLDWAWAFPLPASNGIDLTYQATQGWRLPTVAELAAAPLATDFLFAGANVPYSGVDPISGASFQATNAAYTGAGACATPYFNSIYKHCDWQDGNGQPSQPWAGTPGAASYADQLVVRTDVSVAVPEPGTLILLGSGVVALAGALRRRSKQPLSS